MGIRKAIKVFEGIDYTLRVYEEGFVLEVMRPDAKMCSDYESFEHWDSDKEDQEDYLNEMEKAGFFGAWQ